MFFSVTYIYKIPISGIIDQYTICYKIYLAECIPIEGLIL